MSETSSQSGTVEEQQSNVPSRQSDAGQPERKNRFPLPPVKGTLGGIAPSRLGASQYERISLARSGAGHGTEDKFDEVRDMEGALTGSTSTYLLADSNLEGRFRVDPTLKTCFSVERDGADVCRLWA